jgi:hypothetical protein
VNEGSNGEHNVRISWFEEIHFMHVGTLLLSISDSFTVQKGMHATDEDNLSPYSPI